MANILFSILSTFNDKGLKQATKQVSFFEKSIKSFAKVFAAAFSARALTNFSKTAVKAFMADEKAAKSLEQQLKNTGYQFSAPGVELYISNLQKATGVLDDELRPAFQQLLTVTGSITKSQEALNTALNISAGTGKSLSEVSAALTRGFSGNTTGLSRLGAGLSKTLLKTGDMDKIMAELNDKFSGQSAARLSTYAGKMDQLTVASANAKEIIGKGLLDSLTLLSKDDSIKNAADDMEYFAQTIADAAFGMASLLKKFDKATGLDKVSTETLLMIENPLLYLLSGYGNKQRPMAPLDANKQRSAGRISAKQFQTEDKLTKAKALELALLLKKNAIENKNVEELRKKFDIERIGLTAALNAATDEETKLKLRSLLAILDNNDAMAKKLIAELEAAEALKKLAEQAKLAGMSIEEFGIFKVKTLSNKIDTYIEDLALSTIRELNARIAATLAKFNFTSPAAAAPSTQMFTGPSGATYTAPQVQAAILDTRELNSRINDFLSGFSTGGVQRSSTQEPMQIKVTVDAGGDRLSQAIAESIQVATRSGYSTVPAGFIA
jgi:hypothetical protein